MLNRRERVGSGRLTGLTAAHVQVRRLTREQALAEIARVLAEFPTARGAEILADAAAAHVDGDRHQDAAATELLAAAGADLEQARRIRAERTSHPNPLATIVDQANRSPRGPHAQ